MKTKTTEIKVRGKKVKVPFACINNTNVIVIGNLIKMAVVQDDEWLEGQVVSEPEAFLEDLKREKLNGDIFSFVQKLPETQPKYNYHMEWDNVAAIPITSYQEWWEKRLPQVARKNIRRGGKRGVVARVVDFNDELVSGIIGIHNDTLTRQGMPFVHYGKSFDVVKSDYASFMDVSEFIGAYLDDELIGVIKLIYMGKIASIMQIISKSSHYDKRPTNILIAKAVEVCEEKGMSFLVYGKYIYGNKTKNTLTEFKGRNGFEKIDLPRYYIPLTTWGNIAIKLKLHRGLLGLLPARIINILRNIRSSFVRLKMQLSKSGGKINGQSHHEMRTEVEAEDNH